MKTRLILIDDNTLFRKGLGALLAQNADMDIVDDMGGGREVVPAVLRLDPDVLILDIKLTGSSGLDIVAQIKNRKPRIKTVLLTESRTEDHVTTALRIGADGYVLKDATLEELVIAVRSTIKGKKYISPDVSGQLVSGFLHPEQSKNSSSELDVLTNRERGVLQLIAEGRTNRSAAEFLSVSPKTVEKHRASLMQKLGLKNATDVVLAALELGLIDRPSYFTHRTLLSSRSGLASATTH
jgi:DNA-binding NarL/FixJ family response regulator